MAKGIHKHYGQARLVESCDSSDREYYRREREAKPEDKAKELAGVIIDLCYVSCKNCNPRSPEYRNKQNEIANVMLAFCKTTGELYRFMTNCREASMNGRNYYEEKCIELAEMAS